jgi:hypothetical protein
MIRTIRLLLLLATALLPVAASAAPTPGQNCEKAAADALRACVGSVGRLSQQCYRKSGSACLPGDAKIQAQLDRVATRVLGKCTDQATVQAGGYGPMLTPAGLVARQQNACTTAIASLAARSYGGPHAIVRAEAFPSDQKCLDEAWKQGQSLINYGLQQQSTCIRNTKAGKTCDTAGLASKLAVRESTTATRVAAKCATPLADLVAVDPTVFAQRAATQARCLVATAHGDTTPLVLDCGPRAVAPVPARGVNTQIILPRAIWGSRCGDGSDYAFRVRLAPAGSPVQKVVVHMGGGGVCVGGPDCAGKPADLFEATSDDLPNNGMMSSTDASNPFRDWTKVSLPYCTQDLHIGGGATTAYPEITVYRHGALNVRAAMLYLRDAIWAELQASDPEGYRADRPIVIFSGSSAGGYGAAYNYHWMLDDLGWVNTTAVPDAGLGMDNGSFGVIALGAIGLPAEYPGWNVQPFLPPYCKTAECAEIFGNLEVATSPRLLGTPYQQMLHVTNQIDTTQVSTTIFPSIPAFVNTLRSTYCDIRGLPGLHSFLRAASMHIHGQLNNNNYDTATIAGTTLRDWLGGAMSNPAAVTDRTQEGTLVVDYPGVLAFPCALP